MAVPGRVRVRIPALRRDAEAIQEFLRVLLSDRLVMTARINPRTGSVRVHFTADIPTQRMLDLLAAVAGGKRTGLGNSDSSVSGFPA